MHCVSQCDEAVLLGLFHVRVAGYNHVRHWLEKQKVVLAQKEGSAGPSRQGCCAGGWVSIPARHSRGHRCFQIPQQKQQLRNCPFHSLNTVFEGKDRYVTDIVQSSDRRDWISISTLYYLISERERLIIILPGTYMFLN